MTQNALLVKRDDPNAEIDRAFIVRATAADVARLGGWRSATSGTVYVLELWGDMTLCHRVPSGADPCAQTEGITLVYDAATLRTRDVVYGRLGAEQLGRAFELSVTRLNRSASGQEILRGHS